MRNLESHQEYTYHCKDCKYDLCKTCVLEKSDVIQPENTPMQVISHECKVKKLDSWKNNAQWTCSMTKEANGDCCRGHFAKDKRVYS